VSDLSNCMRGSGEWEGSEGWEETGASGEGGEGKRMIMDYVKEEQSSLISTNHLMRKSLFFDSFYVRVSTITAI